MRVTGLYAAILALYAAYLSFRVGALRGKTKISILHGDDMELAEAMRAHGNFTEYVPMALILFALIEYGGAHTALIHSLGGVLVLSRVAHAVGLKHDDIAHPGRAVGALGTLLVTLIAAGMAVYQFVF